MSTALLAPGEPAPFTVVNAGGRGRAVLVCDHASNRVPRSLQALGLTRAQLASHIAWDPGAALVARALAQLLDAPLVQSSYSRLVIDCNRPLASAELMAGSSAGVVVPGNGDLSPAARQERIATLFEPYHAAIERLLDARAAHTVALLSIHSFTPVWDGVKRPWPLGLSYGRDPRLAQLLLPRLAARGVQPVGDNQPYAIEYAFDHTLPVHGEARNIAHVLIEIRQDELTTSAAAAVWARHIAGAFMQVEADIAPSSA